MANALRKQNTHRPVQKRLLFPLAAVFIVLIVSTATTLLLVQRSHLKYASHEFLEKSYSEFSNLLENQSNSLSALLAVLVQDKSFERLLASADRNGLYDKYQPLFAELRENYNITHLYFQRPDRTNILRVHKPGRSGDIIDRYTTRHAQGTGLLTSGLELGTLGTLTLRVVQPVFHKGEFIGLVEVGKEIEDVLAKIHLKFGADCFLAVNKKLVERSGWEEGMKMLGRAADWNESTDMVVNYRSPELSTELTGQILSAAPLRAGALLEKNYEGHQWHILSWPLPDATGKVIGQLFLLHDITRQVESFNNLGVIVILATLVVGFGLICYLSLVLKRTDRHIHEQQERLFVSDAKIRGSIDVLDKLGLGVRIVNRSFYADEVNETARSWFGPSADGCCYEGVSATGVPCVECPLGGAEVPDGSVRFESKDAAGRIFDVSVVPLLQSDGSVHMMEVIDDITERRENEHQLQRVEKIEAVGTLAGGLAHDFNNILTGLFGNIALAKARLAADHPANKALERATNSLKRATNLTGKLLTFSKGGDPIVEYVRLEDVIREVVEFDLSGSNVRFEFEPPHDIWAAEVDKAQAQQIFSNLTLNARQAMAEGGTLSIRLQNAAIEADEVGWLSTGTYLKIEVSDQGCGIPAEQVPHIFEPYFSTKQKGHGLGLATIHSIVRRHGGHTCVQSEVGRGTTFTIYLPASRNRRLARHEEMEIARDVTHFDAKILVMDDEEDIRLLTKEILTMAGCSVVTTCDGDEALKEYKRALQAGTPFDLVLLDLTIPGGMGGPRAAQEILQINNQARLVVSSGYADNSIMANYADHGFRAVVTKPFTAERLTGVVATVLSAE